MLPLPSLGGHVQDKLSGPIWEGKPHKSRHVAVWRMAGQGRLMSQEGPSIMFYDAWCHRPSAGSEGTPPRPSTVKGWGQERGGGNGGGTLVKK